MGTGTGSLSEIVVAGLDEVVACVDRFAVVPSALMYVMTAPGGIPGPVTTLPMSFRPWSFGDGAISAGVMPVNDLSPWVSALKVLVGSALCPDSVRLACRYIQQTSSVSLTIITLPHSSSSPFFLAPPSRAGSYWPLTR